MEKEKPGFNLAPEETWDGSDGGILFWSLFFLYTLILLLVDKSSFLAVFLSGLLTDWGLESDSDYFGACLVIGLCVAAVCFLFYLVASGTLERKPGEGVSKHLSGTLFDLSSYDSGDKGTSPHPGFSRVYFLFVCVPGLPLYWIWEVLQHTTLRLLFELTVIVLICLLPCKNAAIVFAYLYGVFMAILWGDFSEASEGIKFFRFLLSLVVMAFVCFRHLVIT